MDEQQIASMLERMTLMQQQIEQMQAGAAQNPNLNEIVSAPGGAGSPSTITAIAAVPSSDSTSSKEKKENKNKIKMKMKKKKSSGPAKWRMGPQDKVIGWVRQKGEKNPAKYGLAVNKKLAGHQVLQEHGQEFPRKVGQGAEGEPVVLQDGKVFWFATFVRKRDRRKEGE